MMYSASKSRVAAACSPAREPSDALTSSQAASNAAAKFFVVSASKTLFATDECTDIKVLLQQPSFNSEKVERLPSAPRRSRCTRKLADQLPRQSDGSRFQRVASGNRNHGRSDRRGSRDRSG